MDQNGMKTQTELDLDIEIRQIKSLIALCEDQAILPPVLGDEVDVFVTAYRVEPTDLGLVSLKSRLRSIHKALHEVLYAPKSR